jgi:predicted DCC family thiol-disulfide oxidoreductase YuxK
MINESGRPIVLYDGVCGLCDGFVQFIIKRDTEAHVRFAALQSGIGKELLRTFGLPEGELSFIVVIDGEKSYVKSAAVLEVLRYLPGAWSYLTLLRFIPASISDFAYDFTARNRYKWFGKYEACVIPTHNEKKRFLS